MTSDRSHVYDYKGVTAVQTNFGFLEDALTTQSRKEGMITPYQFLKIQEIHLDDEDREVYFTCEVYEYLLN